MKRKDLSAWLILFLCMGCHSSTKLVKQEFTTTTYSTRLPDNIKNLHDQYVDSLLNNESVSLPFDDDTSFVADSILIHQVDFGWTVFLLKGSFLPSRSEYHFYGVIKNGFNQLGFYSMPIEIETLLTNYIASESQIKIFGKQWDESGLDDGSKPPKKSTLIIQFP